MNKGCCGMCDEISDKCGPNNYIPKNKTTMTEIKELQDALYAADLKIMLLTHELEMLSLYMESFKNTTKLYETYIKKTNDL